jgi:signal transduction histidine kinase
MAAEKDIAAASQVSRVLAAESFITVPFRCHSTMAGRLYLTALHRRAFTASDIDFLIQALEHTTPVLDKIWLVDQLALYSAAAECQRIAHDLHDSVLQSYVGFQIGVEAIRQKLRMVGTDITDFRDDIERLSRLTDIGIADIRRYMRGLRNGHRQESSLPQAVQRFARIFTETTGIAVHVTVEGDMSLHDRLAAEVFQMVAEGLSNVRRHTSSLRATICLACHKDHLILRIENDAVVGTTPVPFTPRSLTERVEALGGQVCVDGMITGRTVVRIDIPL